MQIPELLEKYDGDVFLYYGNISRDGYHDLSSALEDRKSKKDKACLILITYGGDPDAGYRLARATHHHYQTTEVLIPDICKSAGTLLCIGANKLIFGDRGELGPLDIQISKPDELFENMSGLDIIQALNALENQVLTAFRNYLMDIRGGSKLRTKLAADIAAKLADGFISPIAEKIDPVTLGEHQRAMQIAFDYGDRLNKMADSLKQGSLIKLVSGYPSHGFVIDRKEASSLFKNVEAPNDSTIGLYDWARGVITNAPYPDTPLVIDIAQAVSSNKKTSQEEENKDETQDADVEGSTDESANTDAGTEQESAADQPNDEEPDK